MHSKLGKKKMAGILSRESPFSRDDVIRYGRYVDGGDYETIVIGDFQLFYKNGEDVATIDAPLYLSGDEYEEKLIKLKK